MSLRSLLIAEAYIRLAWMRNNKLLLILELVWPYAMVAIILVLGTAYGDIETYKSRLGVKDPYVFLVSSSFIAYNASVAIENSASIATWHRWLGTLPYLSVTVKRLWNYVIVSGFVNALASSVITLVALTPGILVLSGAGSALNMVIVLGILLIGILPLITFSGVAAMATILAREESSVLSFITPLIILVSGIFYPIEILPRLLRLLSQVIPLTYIVEASKTIAVLGTPFGAKVYSLIFVLSIIVATYTLLGVTLLNRLETESHMRGAI